MDLKIIQKICIVLLIISITACKNPLATLDDSNIDSNFNNDNLDDASPVVLVLAGTSIMEGAGASFIVTVSGVNSFFPFKPTPSSGAVTSGSCLSSPCSVIVSGASPGSLTLTAELGSVVDTAGNLSAESSDSLDVIHHQAPTITAVASLAIDEDDASSPILFTIFDTETVLNCTSNVTVTSSNNSIIDSSDIAIASLGSDCTIVLNPKSNQYGGPTTITLTVSDGAKSAQTTFDLTVNSIIDKVTIVGKVLENEILQVTDYGPDFTASSVHQWMSNGVAIAGATAATYTVAFADEEKLITLSLDGNVNSINSLSTFYASYLHENKLMTVESLIDDIPVTYTSLVNSTDQGLGVVQFNSGLDGSFLKSAVSTSYINDTGSDLNIILTDIPADTTLMVGLVARHIAIGAATSLIFSRDVSVGTYTFYVDGVAVFQSGSIAIAELYGIIKVERTFQGFELSKDGIILYSAP